MAVGNRKVLIYPSGFCDVVSSNRVIFSAVDKKQQAKIRADYLKEHPEESHSRSSVIGCTTPANFNRSMRRAKSRFRQLALANQFDYFVTLTLNPDKIDRYNPSAVVKSLTYWCNNMVKRHNLTYILIPERHKDGALHFHGFFKGDIDVVDSGHTDKNGHIIYNLPQWSLGFTTAIKLYGEYDHAVSYCCKYIGKQGDKPAGRWYYSGGDLQNPVTVVTSTFYCDDGDCFEIMPDYNIYLQRLIPFDSEVLLGDTAIVYNHSPDCCCDVCVRVRRIGQWDCE